MENWEKSPQLNNLYRNIFHTIYLLHIAVVLKLFDTINLFPQFRIIRLHPDSVILYKSLMVVPDWILDSQRSNYTLPTGFAQINPLG